ncbi:MAG: hypothetical protein ACREHV_07385 [Rhizomicrobium sp.]
MTDATSIHVEGQKVSPKAADAGMARARQAVREIAAPARAAAGNAERRLRPLQRSSTMSLQAILLYQNCIGDIVKHRLEDPEPDTNVPHYARKAAH